jgi:serine/threonine protein kinase
LFACKVIRFRQGEISREDAEREYSILSRLNHPNIVKYVDYRWRPDKAKLYMEYCPEGNLLDIIKESQMYYYHMISSSFAYVLLTYCISTGSSLSEVLVWSALAQLASALMYCHYGVRTSWDGSTPVSYPAEEWDPVIHRDIKPANGSPFACSPPVSRADFGSPCEQQYKRLYLGQAWRFRSVQSHR